MPTIMITRIRSGMGAGRGNNVVKYHAKPITINVITIEIIIVL